MSQIERIERQGSHIIFDSSLLNEPDVKHFHADFWLDNDLVTGKSVGRGTTYFVRHQQHSWVLRQYLRGGLVRHFNKKYYWGADALKSRSWREFSLLYQLKEMNLPVPRPVAAIMSSSLFWHCGSLLIETIADAEDTHHKLLKGVVADEHWFEIGKAIAQLHYHNVYHPDLNIHNILIDINKKVWIIDFDKGTLELTSTQKRQMLDRLKRSLNKEQVKNSHYHWQSKQWQVLMDGYTSTQTL